MNAIRCIGIWVLVLMCSNPVHAVTKGVALHLRGARIPVLSSPNEGAYPTLELTAETRVVAYHVAGDFVGIRPPAGSYSWVAMDRVQRTSNPSVGVVLGDSVPAYVGTDAGIPQSLASHIELNKGERVRILGVRSVRLVAGAGVERCFQIAPPRGEFRWVSKAMIQSSLPSALLRADKPNYLVTASRPMSKLDPQPKQRPVQQASKTAPAPEGQTQPKKLAEIDDAKKMPPADIIVPSIAELSVMTSQMVLKPIADWDLDSIRDRVVVKVREGESAVERGQARLLLERIDQFRATQERWLKRNDPTVNKEPGATPGIQPGDVAPASFAQPVPSTTNSTSLSPTISIEALSKSFSESLVGTGVAPAAKLKSDPQNVGWLVEVRATGPISPRERRMLPRFAVVDDKRRVKRFVLPVPGLNLRAYRNKKVSLYGNLLNVVGSETPVLIVDRVIVLR